MNRPTFVIALILLRFATIALSDLVCDNKCLGKYHACDSFCITHTECLECADQLAICQNACQTGKRTINVRNENGRLAMKKDSLDEVSEFLDIAEH